MSDQGCVILLHGLGRTAGSMWRMDRALARAEYRTLRLNYPARRQSLAQIVDTIQPAVDQVARAHVGPVHFMTHSLGGLVVRAYLAAHRPATMGRVVMLAPPNQGSEWADLVLRLGLDRAILGPTVRHLRTWRAGGDEALLGAVDYPLGIIAGNRALDPVFPRLLVARPNDGKVSVASTQVDGMADHIVMPVTHTLMTMDPRVIRQSVAFLRDGRFERAGDR
jgi:pimeloyl-ACP methyl ester carboxylesterase